MQTKVNTVMPVTRKKKTSLHHAVETMVLTNVLVVTDMKCNLFSCASANKNDGIQTHLNSDRHIVLPSGAHINFANTKKHYSIGVNVKSEDSAYVATSNSTDTADVVGALPRVMTL